MTEGAKNRIRRMLYEKGAAHEQRLFRAARAITEEHFKREISLFAPLYLSNYCVNNCRYCAFRRDNHAILRRSLNEQALQSEAEALVAQGHRTLLLVSGEHPKLFGKEAVAEAARIVGQVAGVKEVRAEVMPMTVAGYQLLAENGVRSVIIYQETYDKIVYTKAHPDGPKANYAWRINAPDRVLAAGIPAVGLGILLGLSGVAEECEALVSHAQALHERWGIWPTISLPRIQPASEAPWSANPPEPVDDALFVRLIALVRVLLPECGIILSTRESPTMRDRLLKLGIGITQMSAGSRTDVGGYTQPQQAGQFSIQDDRSVEDVAGLLESFGYRAELTKRQ